MVLPRLQGDYIRTAYHDGVRSASNFDNHYLRAVLWIYDRHSFRSEQLIFTLAKEG